MPIEPSATPRHVLTVSQENWDLTYEENNWDLTLTYTEGNSIAITNALVNSAIEDNPAATGESLGLGTAAYTSSSAYAPASHTQAISTITGLSDGTGTIDILNGTVQGTLTANHIHGNLAGNVYTHVRAGENLAKGDPVYVSGSHGSGATLIPIVSKADASNNAKMPAIGIMDAAVTANNNGHMVIVGTITELNTNAYAVNDTLYVASGGGFTSTPPTTNPQPVARVERANTNNGAIIVKVNGILTNSVTSATTTNFTTGQVLYANGTNVGSLSRSGIDTRTSFPNDDVTAATSAGTAGTLVKRPASGNVEFREGIAIGYTFGGIGITVGVNSIVFNSSFGQTVTLVAGGNGTVTLPTGTGTLAFTSSTVDLSTAANGLKSATTTVSVSAATAPTSGQVLTATSSTTATWQTPSGGTVAVGSITGLGTGVATALAVNVGSAGAFVVNGGALGTPSSGTLTSCTGLPISTGVSGLASGIATFLADPTSANLAAAVTGETGTGALVFGTSPTIVTPTIAQINVASSLLILGSGASGLLGLRSNSATGYSSLELLNSGGTQMGGFGYGNASAGSYADQVYYYTNSKALILASFAGRRDFFLSTTGDVSIGSGAAANTRAVLDLTSTTKGFLPPRMTTIQRDAITSAPAGLMLYNTTTNTFDGRNNSNWISLFSSAASSITSASLAAAMTDETGGGSLVFANNPTITSASLATPSINAPTITNRIDVNGNPVHIRRTNTGIIRESLFNENPPTGNEDNINGFAIGCRWYMLNGDRYICRDNTTSSAVWKKYPVNIPLAVIEDFSSAANTITADGGALTVRKSSIDDVYIANNQICEILDIQAAGSASAINLDTLPLLKNLTINGLSNLTTIDLSNNTDIEVIDLEDVIDLASLLTPAVTNLTSLSIVNSLNLQLGSLDLGMSPSAKYSSVDVLHLDRIGNTAGNTFNIDQVPNATSISVREIIDLTFYGASPDPHPVQTLTVDYCPLVTGLPFNKLTSLTSLTWRGRDATYRQPIMGFDDFDLTLVSTFDNQFSYQASVSTIDLPATLTNWNLTGSILGSPTITGTPNLTHLTLDNAEVAPAATFDLTTSIAFVNVTHLSAVAATGDFAPTGGLTDGMTSLLMLDLSQSSIDVDLTNNTLLTNLTLSNWSGTDLQNLTGNPNTGTLTSLVYLDVSNSAAITNLDITSNILLSELYANGCGLSTSSVDSILLLLDTAGLSNGTLDISGGTNAAPTGGASNAELLSLQGKGWTVTHN